MQVQIQQVKRYRKISVAEQWQILKVLIGKNSINKSKIDRLYRRDR